METERPIDAGSKCTDMDHEFLLTRLYMCVMYSQSRADMAVNPAATQGTLSMSRWRWAAGPLAMTAPILNEGRSSSRRLHVCGGAGADGAHHLGAPARGLSRLELSSKWFLQSHRTNEKPPVLYKRQASSALVHANELGQKAGHPKKQHAGLQIASGSSRVRGPHLRRRRDERRRCGRAASPAESQRPPGGSAPRGGDCPGRVPPRRMPMLQAGAELLRRRRRRCCPGVRRLPVVLGTARGIGRLCLVCVFFSNALLASSYNTMLLC